MRKVIIQELQAAVSGTVIPGGRLDRHTTYRVGGPAEALVLATGPDDLERACRFALGREIPLTVLGAGSNVIVPDSGIEGIVVRTVCSLGIHANGPRVVVRAGAMLDDLIRGAAERGLGGLTALAGIPGTVGGALLMNAGTDAGTISDRLEHVRILHRSGRLETIPVHGLRFGYRHSPLADTGAVVLSAAFALEPASEDDVLVTLEAALEKRRRSYPLDLPSAGSVFRRPPGDYAGRLIELAGCKGMRVGDAAVSNLHANFIVNAGDATAADIMELIEAVRERVRQECGVVLELEQIPLPRVPPRPSAW